ncbi:MAG: hypothetical protein RL332_1050, partial [Actinomycetota bacterium]
MRYGHTFAVFLAQIAYRYRQVGHNPTISQAITLLPC